MLRPDLSGARIIGFDEETYDPGLKDTGNGVYRKDGYVLGFSIAVEGFKDYYSLAHKDTPASERAANLEYLKYVCSLDIPKVGANILYDFDWTENGMGIPIKGKLHDVQIAEPLLNEYRDSYSLDSLSHDYLGKGKSADKPKKFCEDNGLKGDFRQYLYLMPFETVREYGTDDADDAIRILPLQLKELEAQGLRSLYDTEAKLIRPLLNMRKNGVRIDTKLRDDYANQIEDRLRLLNREFARKYGVANVRSSLELISLFNRLGLPLMFEFDKKKKEVKKNPSFKKELLQTVKHPVAQDILNIRELYTVLSFFFDGAFVNNCVAGRIHGEFCPNETDDSGTVTGRFSARNPNLQQISSPDRDDKRGMPLGKMCRDIFIPEEGCDWLKIDHKSIEYRVITHFATGPKSDEMRAEYNRDPFTDFHNMAIKWAFEQTGEVLGRTLAKNLGFGSAYYMGIKAMMAHFGWEEEDCRRLQSVYFKAFPFIEPTRNNVVAVAKGRGYVCSPLGRRSRVTPDLRKRKKEYIIFNHLIQGTAADVLKKGIVDVYEAGIFDELKMHLTVHDELDASVPRTKKGTKTVMELKRIMEQAVKLSVPLIAEPDMGPSWGSVEKVDLDARLKLY
jgi:DNA polymerase-1